MRIATLFVACATVATALANSSTDPQIKVTHDGKLVSVVDGQSYDHGDMASKTVQRRNSENIVDLMKEMILGNKALAGSIDSQSSDMVIALKELGQQVNASGGVGVDSTIIMGGGTSTQTGGHPWNPVKVAALQDLVSATFHVTFPQGMELISDKSVDFYQCKFTLLDAKGTPTSEARWSKKTYADTPRTFKCVTPAWNNVAEGKLPGAKSWKTALSVWENDREMPAPKVATIHTWAPNTPQLKLAEILKTAGGGAKAYTLDFEIDYPYGAAGYEEVQFTTKSSSVELSAIKVNTKDAKTKNRVLQFNIKTKQNKATYKILITCASKSTGLRSLYTLTISHTGELGRDKEAPATSCQHVKNEDSTSKDGQYWIKDAKGQVLQHYCKHAQYGGGWTLLMKMRVADTFHGKTSHWTKDTVLNAGNPNPDWSADAKYHSFNSLPIKQLLIESNTGRYALLNCEMSQLGGKPQTLLYQMQKTTQELTYVQGGKTAMNIFAAGVNQYPGWCGRGGKGKGPNKAWRINGWNRNANFVVRLGSQLSHYWTCGYGADPRGVSTGASASGIGLYDRNWGGYSHSSLASAGLRHAHDYSGHTKRQARIWGR